MQAVFVSGSSESRLNDAPQPSAEEQALWQAREERQRCSEKKKDAGVPPAAAASSRGGWEGDICRELRPWASSRRVWRSFARSPARSGGRALLRICCLAGPAPPQPGKGSRLRRLRRPKQTRVKRLRPRPRRGCATCTWVRRGVMSTTSTPSARVNSAAGCEKNALRCAKSGW